MSRGLTSAYVTALETRAVEPIMLVKLDFDSGADRLWTGYGDITWDSQTWNGAGELLEIRPFSETTDIQATNAMLTISGIPSAYISTALQEDYQGRDAFLYYGALDANGDVIADPATFAGRMDQMNIRKSGETCTIAISIESQLVDLRRSREFRYTDQDQRIDYPSDKGFEYVAGMQDKSLSWGPDNRGPGEKARDLARRRSDVSLSTKRFKGGKTGDVPFKRTDAVDEDGNVVQTGLRSLDVSALNDPASNFDNRGGGGR